MKRWQFTILLFLLLGTVVNIAVAWGCETFRPGRWATRDFTAEEAQEFCS